MSLKNPVTRPGIDPGTVRLVTQWRYMVNGSKSGCCRTGNFPQGFSLVLNERGAISEFENGPTQECINSINLRTLQVETFNILKVFGHKQEYGRHTVISEQRIHKTSS
jgi:hypothetical protein